MIDSLLDDAPCGFVAFADDGTIVAVNRTLAEIVDCPKAELEGSHVRTILSPGARLFYDTHVFPMLKMHGSAEEIFITLQTREGRDVPMLMNGVRRDRGGAPVNECILMRMIQRHEFEDQLVQARRLAEQAAAAKATFLSMMSHDLRTPLTAISGHADILAAGVLGPLRDEQVESVDAIRGAAREVARLIDDILSFAQLESGKVAVRLEPVPVESAIARAESLIRLRARQADLTVSSDAGSGVSVAADADRLQQILLNLLTNAIKFTPPGGRISVECEDLGERVAIRVRDTGVGIPADQLERIFDPFVQLDAQRSGTQAGVGLGLAISRDLARAMDGELTASSAPGEGSVFSIELPAAATSTV